MVPPGTVGCGVLKVARTLDPLSAAWSCTKPAYLMLSCLVPEVDIFGFIVVSADGPILPEIFLPLFDPKGSNSWPKVEWAESLSIKKDCWLIKVTYEKLARF